MAKALFGYTTTAADPRLAAEVRALRCRVRDLTDELDRQRAENAVLAAALEVVDGTDTLSVDDGETGTVALPELAHT